MQSNDVTFLGTIGGTFISILPALSSQDIYRTVSLAAIGAAVSFLVSLVLKIIIERSRKKWFIPFYYCYKLIFKTLSRGFFLYFFSAKKYANVFGSVGLLSRFFGNK